MKQILGNKTALVIGGGHYRIKACRYFKEHHAHVILVDHDPACKARGLVAKNDFILKDGRNAWDLAFTLKPDFNLFKQ